MENLIIIKWIKKIIGKYFNNSNIVIYYFPVFFLNLITVKKYCCLGCEWQAKLGTINIPPLALYGWFEAIKHVPLIIREENEEHQNVKVNNVKMLWYSVKLILKVYL